MRGSPIARLCLLAVLAVLAALPAAAVPVPAPAAASVAFGVSDQSAAALTDSSLAQLPIRHARLIVPWDVALGPGAEGVDRWLAQAAAGGHRPMIAFERRREDRCPGGPCHLPGLGEYRAAVRAFVARWPQVRELTPWNEPNHPSQPTLEAPDRVAGFHRIAVEECGGCTVVAADVLDSSAMERWLTSFRASLGDLVPRVWGLHNYADVNRFGSDRTDAFLREVPGQVWLTETGGIVYLRDSSGRITWERDERRAADAVDHLVDVVARRSRRIERAYLYQWHAPAGADFDAGVIAPDGFPRPAFGVLRTRLAEPVGAPPEEPGGPGAPGAVAESPAAGGGTPSRPGPGDPAGGGDVRRPGSAPAVSRRARVTVGGVRVTRRGDLRVALACAAGGRTCSGRLQVRPARRARRSPRWAAGSFKLRPGAATWVRARRRGGSRARRGLRTVIDVRVAGRELRSRRRVGVDR